MKPLLLLLLTTERLMFRSLLTLLATLPQSFYTTRTPSLSFAEKLPRLLLLQVISAPRVQPSRGAQHQVPLLDVESRTARSQNRLGSYLMAGLLLPHQNGNVQTVTCALMLSQRSLASSIFQGVPVMCGLMIGMRFTETH